MLSVALVVMWVRSYWYSDSATLRRIYARYGVKSLYGMITVYYAKYPRRTSASRFSWHTQTYHVSGLAMRDLVLRENKKSDYLLGFGYGINRRWPFYSNSDVWIPYWFFVVVTGILPAIWTLRWRRLHREARAIRLSLCPNCGYDLRASKDHCPECGTPIEKSKTRRQKVKSRTE